MNDRVHAGTGGGRSPGSSPTQQSPFPPLVIQPFGGNLEPGFDFRSEQTDLEFFHHAPEFVKELLETRVPGRRHRRFHPAQASALGFQYQVLLPVLGRGHIGSFRPDFQCLPERRG